MLLVQNGPQPAPWPEYAFVNAVFARHLHPETPVSFDGGRSWMPAWPAAQSLHARGDDGLAVVVPTNVEQWCMGAGYAAIFSGLFFGGPLALGASIAMFENGPRPLPMLVFALVAFVLGPLPIAAMALVGLRNLRKNPVLRGKGRAIFALVVAGILGVPNVVAILVYLFRSLFG